MPKEKVQAVRDGCIVPELDVVVGWSRDTGVLHIATAATNADDILRGWVECEPDRPTQTAPGTSFRMFDGWHVPLDRAGVNRLIRLLRQARDAAFGKDE